MESKITINCVIGIDPGAAGGIAVFIPSETFYTVKTAKMPKNIADLRDFFAYYAENYNPIVFIEKLSVRPDDVSVQDERAKMGKLYRIQKMMANYEHLKALIETFAIPYIMVHPMTWQTKLKLRVRGEKVEKAERKRQYRETAAMWYKTANVTLWNADALLIMHFGRWVLVNEPKWVRAQLPKREYEKLF